MRDIEETALPGVGVRHDFTTGGGARLGVISHRSGRRDLLVYDARDPDRCSATIRLDVSDSDTLSELLGGSHVAERVAAAQRLPGLAIDWLSVSPGSPWAGRSIGEAEVRKRTGVSIVAILRGEETLPAPDANVTLRAGDTLVVAGTPSGVEEAARLLAAS